MPALLIRFLSEVSRSLLVFKPLTILESTLGLSWGAFLLKLEAFFSIRME